MSDGPSVRLGGLGDALQNLPTVPIPSLTEEFPTPPVPHNGLPTVPNPFLISDFPAPPVELAAQNLPTVPFPLDDSANWPTVPFPDFLF
jgi:hypothetical protein